MHIIILDEAKNLSYGCTTTIFQKENLTDQIRFLIPMHYNDIDLAKSIVKLRYIDRANCPHSETLILDDELYKNFMLCYYLPVDSELTKFAGNISVRLAFKHRTKENKIGTFFSGSIDIVIEPLEDYGRFIEEETFELIEEKFERIEEKIEYIDDNKADSLSYEDNKLQLMSNGVKIGQQVEINTDFSACLRFNDAEDAAQYALKKGEPGEIIVVKLDGRWIAHVIEDDKSITPICDSNGEMLEIVFDGDDANGIDPDVEYMIFDGGSSFGL